MSATSSRPKVTVEQFLAFAVPLERRQIQEAKGIVKPFPALPPCPVCSQPVASVVRHHVVTVHYSIGLGCHRLVTRIDSEWFSPSESLMETARRIAASLENA